MKRGTVVIAVLAACIAAAIVVGSMVRARLKRSPMYSLVQVRTAFVTHDTSRFKQYVDLDRATDVLAAEFLRLAADTKGAAGDSGWTGELRKACAGLTQPQLAQILRGQAIRSVSG